MLDEEPDQSRSTTKFMQSDPGSVDDLRIRESRLERSEKGHSRSGSKLNAAAVLRELSPGPGSGRRANGFRPESDQGISARQDEIIRSKHKARTVRTFVDIAKCLQETLEAVRAIFMAHSESEEGFSLLEEMMKHIQEVATPVKQTGRINSTSDERSIHHKRKPSSLASFSVSLVPPSVSAFRQQAARLQVKGDRSSIVTTQSILEALPSSQILLNFLPASIQGFAPFIPSSSQTTGGAAGDMERHLAEWFEKALDFVDTSAKRCLADLSDIRDIWSVKTGVESALQSSECPDDTVITDAEKEKLHAILQQAWNVRIRGIWTAKLTQLVDGLESRVEAALVTLATDERRKDIGEWCNVGHSRIADQTFILRNATEWLVLHCRTCLPDNPFIYIIYFLDKLHLFRIVSPPVLPQGTTTAPRRPHALAGYSSRRGGNIGCVNPTGPVRLASKAGRKG